MLRLGVRMPSPSRPMPVRPLLLAALAVTLALPSAARASDPLLSGYAGPGSGEQVVLGGTTVGGGGGGGGGTGSGSAAAATNQPLRAATPSDTAGPSADSSPATSGKPRESRPSSTKTSGTMTNGTSPTGTSSSTADARPGAPQVTAYPTRAGAVSGLPLSLGDALLVLAGLVLLVLAGLGLRRATQGPGEPPMPQVPVR